MKRLFTVFICILFVLMPASFAEELKPSYAYDNVTITDLNEPCGVTVAKNLLKSENITYNQSELEKCICKNNTDCNADILTIKQCLNEEGLTTYTYTVNESQLQTGDIIHYDYNGTGHYEVFDENVTDLSGFIGYIITTYERKGQETVPIEIQKEIKGQYLQILILLGRCLANPLCREALVMGVGAGAGSVALCASNLNECKKNVENAWNKVRHKRGK